MEVKHAIYKPLLCFLGLTSATLAVGSCSRGNTSLDKSMFIGMPISYSNLKGAVYKCEIKDTTATCLPATAVGTTDIGFFGWSIAKTNANLYVGAPGAYDDNTAKGDVFKCNLDGSSCEPLVVDGLGAGDHFGYSLATNNTSLYIGAKGDESIGFERIGKVYQCHLDGTSCTHIAVSGTNIADSFGMSLFATQTSLYVGASKVSILSDEGAVYKCALDGTGCAAIPATGLSLVSADHFGSSLFATSSNLYIGNVAASGQTGAVYKCNLDGADCTTFATGTALSGFGSSLYGVGNILYVGGLDARAIPFRELGTVYKCDLTTASCPALTVTGLDENSYFFGRGMAM